MFARGFVWDDAAAEFLIRERTVSCRAACRLAKMSLAALREAADCGTRPESESRAWLYDNIEMIAESVEGALKTAASLGKMRSVKAAGGRYPVSFVLSYKYLSENENLIEKAGLSAYLKAAAREYELKSGEIGCFDTMLVLSLAVRMAREGEKSVLRVKNAVTSLAALSSTDFSDVFFAASPVEEILSRDPAGIYARMDKKTRLYYHSRAEKLSRIKRISEREAALLSIEAAENETDERKRHVGFFLSEGAPGLNREREDAASAHVFYIASLTVIGAFFAAFFTGGALPAIFSSIFLFEILKKIITRLGLSQTAPSAVLRMDFTRGVPDSHRTLVVISALLDSRACVERFSSLLEEYYLSNRDDNISFGILGDLRDTKKPDEKADGELVSYAREAIARLNEKYAPSPFCLFVRRRIYNEKHGRYMSYERKRGALLELSRLIDTGERGTFCDIVCARAPSSFEHVVTLDFDTRPAPYSVIRLIEAAAHPVNVPRISKDGARVDSGYGILQPRITPELTGADAPLFLRVISGAGGVSAYLNLSGDKYQDFFGDGTYIGKGLFSPRIFSRVLGGAIADNAVLSHDLLEGTYVRVRFVSDVEWTDSEPPTFRAFFTRQARWTRGDFQLLPWLFFRVRDRAGKRVRNPIGWLGRVKIAETLFRALVPAFMTFTAAASAVAAPSFGYFPFVMMIVNLLLPTAGSALSRLRGPRRARTVSQVLSPTAGSLIRAAVSFSILPFEAAQNVGCALKSIWRMAVTKKNLLDWTSAQFFEASGESAGAYYRYMFACPLFSAVLLFFSQNPLAVTLAAIFAASPAAAFLLSRRPKPKGGLSKEERDELSAHARLMWGYFKDMLTAGDNYLIPDNFQTEPYNGAAHRTSPTNIGLSLLCMLAAYDFSLIEKKELFSCVENTLNTVEKLEKYRGHLYNWYDTETLSVLSPRYVSTVDSGNFTGCLIALREGLRALGAPDELTERMWRLIDGTDFAALYSDERRLFYVGYNESAGKYDAAYYDLLASEARLASFAACALRQVPVEHWRSLSRAHLRVGRYGGLGSWTGTMFEYFMPCLLMPPYHDSLICDGLKFSLFAQRRRVGRNNIFGISESAYCAFDQSFSYRYKAFGIPALARKRDADGALVISPYSSYLALTVDTRAAFDNLMRLKGVCPMGKYGFYEAMDFENRLGGEDFAIAKTFMAHHIGMSMISCANAVFGGIMQQRFMSDRRMSAFSMLLKERAGGAAVSRERHTRDAGPLPPKAADSSAFEYETDEIDAFSPIAQATGSRRFSSVTTDAGAGYARFGGICATRRGFRAEDEKGIFFFAGDKKSGECFGLTFAPAYDKGVKYRVRFLGHAASFFAEGYGLSSRLDIFSGAGRPLEIRHAALENTCAFEREASLSIYFEPVLSPFSEDAAHPAFSNLFIETSYNESDRLLIVKRRARDGSGAAAYLVAAFFGDTDAIFVTTSKRCVRTRLSGACELPHEAMCAEESVFGGVTEPCVFARADKTIIKGERVTLGAVIAAGKSLSELLTLARSCRSKSEADIIIKEAAARTAAENDIGRLSDDIRRRALSLLPCLYKNMPARDALAPHIEANTLKKSALWKYGVSGDLPIMLVRYGDEDDRGKLWDALRTFLLFYMRGEEADLVVLYRESGEYMRPVERQIRAAAQKLRLGALIGARGGVHLINALAIPPEDETLILSCAAFVFGEGSDERVSGRAPKTYKINRETKTACPNLKFFNGFGGFASDGYVVCGVPPAPYSHVLSNGRAGAVLSGAGGGYTFIDNAREYKITPMTSDALCEPATETMRLFFGGEEVFLERPIGGGERDVKYEAGAAVYTLSKDGVRASETVFIPMGVKAAARIVTVNNDTGENLTVRAVFCAPLVLGDDENSTFRHIVTSYDAERKLLTARNAANNDFGDYTAFVYCGALSAYTCEYEDALSGRCDTGKTGYVRRACFSVCCDLQISSGDSASFVIIMGAYSNEDELSRALGSTAPRKMRDILCGVKRDFKTLLSKIEISSPDERLNALSNGPLLYQTLVCRMTARTSFYQCGGAWGFRDQLQDCLAVLYIDPAVVREHIIRACSHQFTEGDVQHWWHPIPPAREGDAHRGVRSRCTDDRLWLVFTAMRYAEFTGDSGIFSQDAPFITQPPLKPDERESYGVPKKTCERASVFEHCVRAVDSALSQGAHGLIKIGGGDWNDGFNKVGEAGEGESVWLSWFLCGILADFSKVCEEFGRFELSMRYNGEAKRLLSAIEREAWDGDRYVRAFYDDGTPLGARECRECKIDSLSQSFSVISGPDDISERKLTAIKTAVRELYDREHALVRLFWPPFDECDKNPGYVKGYIPGVRENGGQYTHASLWLCRALFWAGEHDTAYELLSAQNPIRHADTKKKAERYRTEPYAVAADVYSVGENAGVGGWSWYTGAAAWYYVVVIEDLFGIRIRGGRLEISPHLPGFWDGAALTLRHDGCEYRIRYENREKKNGAPAVTLDGVRMASNEIELRSDKNFYDVLVEV
ncbi:MAG: hypothetical protein IKD89_06470 [Clostridia bacterium]|nr:hypothetical protein [Clostridia bacterium]